MARTIQNCKVMPVSLPNPYTPSRTPRAFVGRTEELRRVRNELAPVIAYREPLGGPLVFTGPRGVGKTSLLREIRLWAESQGFAVARTSGQKALPFLADVVDAIPRALTRAGVETENRRKRKLDELGASIGGSLASVSGKVRWVDDEPRPDVPRSLLTALENLLRESAAAVVEHGGAGLVVIVDELHEPLESRPRRRGGDEPVLGDYNPHPEAFRDAGLLLNALQNLDDERDGIPLAFIAAGLPQTTLNLTRAATFAERTQEVEIHELDATTARHVLTVPADELEVTWDADALNRALEIADGYPQALQETGKWAWEAASPQQPGDRITLADLTRAEPRIELQLAGMYRRRWANTTRSEKDFLRAMATLDDPDRSDGAIRRGKIAELLGRETESLSVVRQSCINKGIIEDAGHGYLRFTIPGFGPFVLAQSRPSPRSSQAQPVALQRAAVVTATLAPRQSGPGADTPPAQGPRSTDR